MDVSGKVSLRKSRFTQSIIRENTLDVMGFEEWVFCPGMLFNAEDKWWGDQGKRERPHEGLDLCLYRDRQGRVIPLDEETKIPAMYDGTIVKILDDLLGKSVIMEHRLKQAPSTGFLTIYGHTKPSAGLCIGRAIREGEIVSTLARSSGSKNAMLPHLHISMGWTSGVVPYERLDWETMGVIKELKLIDPLSALEGKHKKLENAFPSCRELLSKALRKQGSKMPA